jgi:protein-S-isoprenylcysteine O-methyltransferase Ste14
MDDALERPPPRWAHALSRFNRWMMFDIGGGPRPFKLATIINLQKVGTFPVIALLMWYYAGKTPAATSTAAWLYLAMHGSYGLTWLMKDLRFPDANWQGRVTILSSIADAAALALYWLAGFVLISGISTQSYPLPKNAWFCLCVSLCILGCVIMIAADVQKFSTLRMKRGLITDGMFKRVRHPNYLGEMMVYGSFALLAWHWIPALVLVYFWGFQFSTNMAMKEASMSRYPEWREYKERSWWLVPYVF